MSTDIDWQHELDGSFGAGEDAPVGHYVGVGHRAVRRRRAVSVVMVAAMTVGVGAAWANGPGVTLRGDAPVATQRTAPTAEARATMSAKEARKKRLQRIREAAVATTKTLGNPGTLTYDGLVLAPDAGPVLERVQNPMGYTADQGRSLGIRVTVGSEEQYALLTAYPDGTSATVVSATGDFAGWLAGAVRTRQTLDAANGVTSSGGDTGDGPWLRLDPDGGVVPTRAGIVVTEEGTGVDLGASFSRDASRVGVVRLLVDGRSEFAAYRVVDGVLDVVPAGGTFDSIEAFITWARQQYASGSGMR